MPARSWLLWWAFVALWTIVLLWPIPSTANDTLDELTWGRKRLVAKSMHVAGYAVLAVLSGRLPIAGRWRWLPMMFILMHACATELLQLHWTGRGGDLHDVGLDHAGVLLGTVVSWRSWAR